MATPVNECRPPEGTASGTWHWVRRSQNRSRVKWRWDGARWCFGRATVASWHPLGAAREGYRYIGPVEPQKDLRNAAVCDALEEAIHEIDWTRVDSVPLMKAFLDSLERMDYVVARKPGRKAE